MVLQGSREILGLLYLHYDKDYGYQSCQSADFLWKASTHKVIYPIK